MIVPSKRVSVISKTSVLSFALAFCFAASANAAPQDEYYISQALDRYYTLPQDARTIALAGSARTTCRGSECLNLNPSGLGRLRRVEFSGGIGRFEREGRQFLADIDIEQWENMGYINAALPLVWGEQEDRHYGTLAFGYSRYRGGTDDTISSAPDGHRRAVAYGLAVSEQVALGYGFTFYDDQLHTDIADLHSHARFLHLFGIQYEPSQGLSVGFTFSLGIGQSDTEDYQLRSDGLSRPREQTASLGLTQAIGALKLSAGVDYSHLSSEGSLDGRSYGSVIGEEEEGNRYNIRIGIEGSATQSVPVRAGFRYEFVDYTFEADDLESLSGSIAAPHLSFGVGYVFGDETSQSPRIDYGFTFRVDQPGYWEQALSLAIPI